MAILGLVACQSGVELQIEANEGDQIVVVSSIDGRTTPRLYAATPGAPLRVDGEGPFFTWVLRPKEHIDALGEPLAAEILAGTTVRMAADRRDANSDKGGCDRCVAPTASSPTVVHPGDSCPLPRFNRGALWTEQDGKYTCAGAEDSTVCRAGSAAQSEQIEQMRQQLRLDSPGTCVCPSPAARTSLADLEILPFAPQESPLPLTHFAANDAGQVAAFSRVGALLYDPASGQTQTQSFPGAEDVTRSAVALRNGNFLVASNVFNSGPYSQVTFSEYVTQDGVLSAPQPISTNSPARPQRMRYLGGEDDDFPLYLIGSVIAPLGLEPAVFACSDDRLACQQVNFSACARREDFENIDDAIIADTGFGLGVAKNALYYKTANPPGTLNPAPNDDWRCAQPLGPYEDLEPSAGNYNLERFNTIGATEGRLFVCGIEKVEACDSARPIVLTASATVSDPTWQVAYQGPEGATCGQFLPRSAGIGLILSGARLIDFDRSGQLRNEGTLFEAFGSLDGIYSTYSLGPDVVLSTAANNRLFVATASSSYQAIYGPTDRTPRTYRCALPRPGGGFMVFGDTRGPVEVDALGQRFTELSDDPVAGVTNAHIYAVASGEGEASQYSLPVLIGGDKDNRPYLAHAVVDANGLTDVRPIELPPDALRVTDIARIGQRWVVGTLGTRLFEVRGDTAQEVPLDWDDPSTEVIERRPADPVDGCSGGSNRQDLWYSMFGAEGVAWATGKDGVVFQLTPGAEGIRAERFLVPEGTLVAAGMAQCSAETLLGVRGRSLDAGGNEWIRLRLLGLQSIDEPRRGEAAAMTLDPRRQGFAPTAEDSAFQVLNVFDIIFGTPVAVLPDVALNGKPSQAVVLSNGYVFRVASGQTRVEHLRVPFDVVFAAQDEAGTILFGAGEGRLAVGAPAIGQSGR